MESRELVWISSSRKDLSKLPKAVQDEALFALGLVKEGDTYRKAKPFKGFSGTTVMEIVLIDRGETFRVLYTAKFEKAIYVLHAFHKKSKKKIKTPKQEVDLIHARFQEAQRLAKGKKK